MAARHRPSHTISKWFRSIEIPTTQALPAHVIRSLTMLRADALAGHGLTTRVAISLTGCDRTASEKSIRFALHQPIQRRSSSAEVTSVSIN